MATVFWMAQINPHINFNGNAEAVGVPTQSYTEHSQCSVNPTSQRFRASA